MDHLDDRKIAKESQKKKLFHLGIAQIFKSEKLTKLRAWVSGAGGRECNLHNSQKKGCLFSLGFLPLVC